MEEAIELRQETLTDFDNLQVGDCLSQEVQFLKVKEIRLAEDEEEEDEVILTDEFGGEVSASRSYVESFLHSANQYENENIVTRTEAVEILKTHPHVVMTVNYYKQPKLEEVLDHIMATYNNSTPKEFESSVKQSIKEAMHGEERTIIGRLASNQNNDFGRFYFIDMTIERTPEQIEKDFENATDSRLRLVDSRSINFIVVQSNKYVVKK